MKDNSGRGFRLAVLPWMVAMAALLLYASTINRWINLRSLPVVSQVVGWSGNLPVQAPLFYTVTFPIRALPKSWEPVALNLFSALCAAIALGFLARSVALLPHDRTLAQIQREKSEHFLLSIKWAWLPPLFAVLVCALQLTMWEHSTAVTGEALDLLVFAYVVRCLLEYRIDRRDSWLYKLALVYGLGVTNSHALIGFFPLFLGSLAWIKGKEFFNLKFIGRMVLFGAAGLLLYLVLPIVWKIKGPEGVTFWQVLKTNLGAQKNLLFGIPGMRNRVLLLSLTSVLPAVFIGIRWQSLKIVEDNASGAALTNFTFRFFHFIFMLACLAAAFDLKYSARALGMGFPFLTFHYLSALSVGYFSGYILLVFGQKVRAGWYKRGAMDRIAAIVMQFAIWALFLAVPIALIYRNFPSVRAGNGTILKQYLSMATEKLPSEGAVLLSDDALQVTLLRAFQSSSRTSINHIVVHTLMLQDPRYHAQIAKDHPGRWPAIAANAPAMFDTATIQRFLRDLVRTNPVYYLHPSFGSYFETLYAAPEDGVFRLRAYETNQLGAPPLTPLDIRRVNDYWEKTDNLTYRLAHLAATDVPDVKMTGGQYSRAFNYWGVQLQKQSNLVEAAKFFQRAIDINPKNSPALSNLEFNKFAQSGIPPSMDLAKISEETFKDVRTWDPLLAQNGPFDEPNSCYRLGQIFLQQRLYRQAAEQFSRVIALDQSHFAAHIALATCCLSMHFTDKASAIAAGLKARYASQTLATTNELQLLSLEATIDFAKANYASAEKILLDAKAKYPAERSVLMAMTEMYRVSGRLDQAIDMIDQEARLEPSDKKIPIRKATLLVEQRRYDDAGKVLDTLIEAAPGNIDALLYKAYVLLQSKKYPDALKILQDLYRVDPNNFEAFLYEGMAHLETQDYDRALAALDKALKVRPNDYTALRNRAIVGLQSGNLDAAFKDYDVLRKLFPNMPAVYYGLGEIAFKKKQTAEAIQNYEAYLKYARPGESPGQDDEIRMVTDRLNALKSGR